MKKPINLRIDTELWGRVQRNAKGRGMTATAVVEEALGRVLDHRPEPDRGLSDGIARESRSAVGTPAAARPGPVAERPVISPAKAKFFNS